MIHVLIFSVWCGLVFMDEDERHGSDFNFAPNGRRSENDVSRGPDPPPQVWIFPHDALGHFYDACAILKCVLLFRG